jgi:hypothetical protein
MGRTQSVTWYYPSAHDGLVERRLGRGCWYVRAYVRSFMLATMFAVPRVSLWHVL